MLTVEIEQYAAAGETLVFIQAAGSRMLVGATDNVLAAAEIGKALAKALGATFSGESETCAVSPRE